MCLRNTQGLVSHYFCFRLHPSLSDSSQPGTALSAKAPRRLHFEKEVSFGDASSKETWMLGEFSKVLIARASGYYPLGAIGSMVPARANQVVRFKRGSIKGTGPNCLDPSPVIHGTQGWSGSRDWKAA